MIKNKPLVSIGVPVYNGGKFLEETLDSLLAQTYKNFELIISDNASTDRTEQICNAYAAKDQRIRYYRNGKNLGASWNYNHVFELSTGEYFKWAAADDLCAPELLQRCVDILDQNPEVVVCYSRTKIIDERGTILEEYHDNLNLQEAKPSERFIKLMRSIRLCNAAFGLTRHSVLKKTPLIGNYISSDVCLLAELSLYGKYFEIPEFMFFRRMHPDASSSNKSADKQLEFFDPGKKGKIVLQWCRLRYENFVSVKQSPIKFREKVFLFGFLILEIYHWRKIYAAELLRAFKQVLFKYTNKNLL